MRITPARPADASKLAAILTGWIDETPWMPRIHSDAATTNFLRKLISEMDVTTVRNWRGPHGFLACRDGMIHAFYLTPGLRGKGWGTRLLNTAKAANPALDLWTFQANTSARRFYARAGFSEAERTDGAGNDEHLPDIRLEWRA